MVLTQTVLFPGPRGSRAATRRRPLRETSFPLSLARDHDQVESTEGRDRGTSGTSAFALNETTSKRLKGCKLYKMIMTSPHVNFLVPQIFLMALKPR